MNPRLTHCLATLALLGGPAAPLIHAADTPPAAAAPAPKPTPESILASQVAEIAGSTTMSPRTRARLIASAVRLAIVTVTDGISDPAERLKRALALAEAAARAAPSFGSAITDAVLSIPALAAMEGVANAVKAAVLAGVKAAVFDNGEVRFDTDTVKPKTEPQYHGDTGDTVVSPSF